MAKVSHFYCDCAIMRDEVSGLDRQISDGTASAGRFLQLSRLGSDGLWWPFVQELHLAFVSSLMAPEP